MAFEPPPTQAMIALGRRPSFSRIWPRISLLITRWRSRTMAGYGMRAEHAAEQVVGCADVSDPVAHRLVDGVFERLRAGTDAADLRAEQPHTVDIQAPDVACLPRPCR